MACATLKRTINWDNKSQTPSKRRRCNIFDQNNGVAAVTSPSKSSMACRAMQPLCHSERVKSTVSNFNPAITHHQLNAFAEVNVPNTSADTVVRALHDEVQRLRGRRQLQSATATNVHRMVDYDLESATVSGTAAEMSIYGSQCADSPSRVARNPEQALFTLEQVQQICERMLKEREDELRHEYSNFLVAKLAEQYDAFVKFTYDQIQSRPNDTASTYLS